MSAVSPELLRRFDVPGPRYTSYPTADRFVEAFGADDYIQALKQRRSGIAMAMPLSLYVHIPFCESLCTLLTLEWGKVSRNCTWVVAVRRS
jgi:oxygen-independent coproporphyrinogen-3 oxidase